MMFSKLNVEETVHRTGIRRVSGGPVVKHTGVCDNGVDFTLGNDLANHRFNIGGQGFAEFDASTGSRADPNSELPGVDRRPGHFYPMAQMMNHREAESDDAGRMRSFSPPAAPRPSSISSP